MDAGNKIRKETKDGSILMKGVARQLYLSREKDESGHPKPRKRVAYIIKSLKHPDEVEFMRDTYGDGFHLIGVTSSYERRLETLTKRKGLTLAQATLLLKKDEHEDLKYGQHTRDAFQHADYFIRITADKDEVFHSVERLINLLFGDPFITPCF